jgi:hypothetical protein
LCASFKIDNEVIIFNFSKEIIPKSGKIEVPVKETIKYHKEDYKIFNEFT